MRVLVCGGRNFTDRDRVFRELDDLHAQQAITCIIHGGAKGADRSAEAWAMSRGVAWRRYLADFATLGKAAGPVRNAKMLAEGRPDLVVSFPGQRGTQDMVRRAIVAGKPVVRVEPCERCICLRGGGVVCSAASCSVIRQSAPSRLTHTAVRFCLRVRPTDACQDSRCITLCGLSI